MCPGTSAGRLLAACRLVCHCCSWLSDCPRPSRPFRTRTCRPSLSRNTARFGSARCPNECSIARGDLQDTSSRPAGYAAASKPGQQSIKPGSRKGRVSFMSAIHMMKGKDRSRKARARQLFSNSTVTIYLHQEGESGCRNKDNLEMGDRSAAIGNPACWRPDVS